MVSCSTVRGLLPEHALGTLSAREETIVDRHLAWCAACRKESADLSRAAATIAFALAPAMPPAELEDRVVRRVRAVAGHRRSTSTRPRRARRAGTLVVAAALALSGLGVGAVIARRSSPVEQEAASAERAADAFEAFRAFIEGSELVDPDSDVFLGMLGPETSGRGGGSVLTIVVPTVPDQAVVMMSGLPDRAALLPYRITLADGKGRVVDLGEVSDLDTGGGATVARVVPRDLTRYVNVLVTDASDRVVLRGTLRERTSVPSPSP
jgi:hypothetical protein